MRHHSDNDPRDALNDYLDSLAGAPPADSRARDLDPGIRDDVDRFFDLAERAGMTRENARRPDMNTTLPASTALSTPKRKARRGITLPSWTQHLHLVSTGLLIVAVIALAFAAFGPGGPGRGGNETGDGPSLNGAVPGATIPDDAATSSIPYPNAEECTVKPMTREEMIAHLEAANTATPTEYERYERAIEPSAEDAQAIMQTFRQWQACSLSSNGPAYFLQFETPWRTANSAGVFYNYRESRVERPVSEDQLQAYTDALLNPEPVASPQAAVATPPSGPEKEQVKRLPIPDGSTPVATSGGHASPMMFSEDIVITGPGSAYAKVYLVDEKTSEVNPGTVLTYGFVKVDGQWLIDSYREGIGG